MEKFVYEIPDSGEPVIVPHNLGTKDVVYTIYNDHDQVVRYVGKVYHTEDCIVFLDGFPDEPYKIVVFG